MRSIEAWNWGNQNWVKTTIHFLQCICRNVVKQLYKGCKSSTVTVLHCILLVKFVVVIKLCIHCLYWRHVGDLLIKNSHADSDVVCRHFLECWSCFDAVLLFFLKRLHARAHDCHIQFVWMVMCQLSTASFRVSFNLRTIEALYYRVSVVFQNNLVH